MDTSVQYRFMEPGEESRVAEMIARVFDEFIGPDYSDEGIREFKKYASEDGLRERAKDNHFALLASAQDRVVGMIEVRNNNHISMLFVDRDYQRQGISRTLLNKALEFCRRERPDLTRVTVNSSPYAVPIYERLGFRATEPEKVVHGIRFIPMVLQLPKDG
jgi:GNAT superfamily N-acetyltransferase